MSRSEPMPDAVREVVPPLVPQILPPGAHFLAEAIDAAEAVLRERLGDAVDVDDELIRTLALEAVVAAAPALRIAFAWQVVSS